MRDKILRIEWLKAMNLDDCIESPLSNSTGLYYITTTLNKEISLYIGIATGTNTVRKRLKAHRDEWLRYYRGNIRVRIGQMIYPRNVTDDMIYDAESAILYKNNFLLDNRQKLNSYHCTDFYRVENMGDIFEIPSLIIMKNQ